MDAQRKRKFELWQQYPDKRLLWDVRLASDDGTEVHANKSDLAAFSPFFELFLNEDWADAHKDVVLIRDMNGPVLREMVRYMYGGGPLPLDSNCVEAYLLLEAGDRFQVPGIVEQCCRFLEDSLSAETAVRTYALAAQHNCQQLQAAARAFIISNMEEVTKAASESDLQALTIDQAVDISKAACDITSVIIPHFEISKFLSAVLRARQADGVVAQCPGQCPGQAGAGNARCCQLSALQELSSSSMALWSIMAVRILLLAADYGCKQLQQKAQLHIANDLPFVLSFTPTCDLQVMRTPLQCGLFLATRASLQWMVADV